MWLAIRDALKRVVGNKLDREDASYMQQQLNTVYDSCSCRNNEIRINHIVKILEDEGFSAVVVFTWFIDVLQDPYVNKPGLTHAIKIRISPDAGPLLK